MAHPLLTRYFMHAGQPIAALQTEPILEKLVFTQRSKQITCLIRLQPNKFKPT